jgi:crotonobetainyl-CoA:carnitine CoA-transferase CaiB-like acyl-CoA transferase
MRSASPFWPSDAPLRYPPPALGADSAAILRDLLSYDEAALAWYDAHLE